MAGILDILEMIKPEVRYTKSGKQNIPNTPFEIDSEVIDAILKLNIPLNDKLTLLGDYERRKGRDQIFLDDQELFVGEGGERIRKLGLGYNLDKEGLSGYGS